MIVLIVFAIILGIADLTQEIARLSRDVTLVSIAISALAWAIGSGILGSPLKIRELREFGSEARIDAIRSIFWLSMYCAISSLVTYVVSLISLAME